MTASGQATAGATTVVAATRPGLAAVPAPDPSQGAELSAVTEELLAQIEHSSRACALLERERAKYVDLFMSAPDAYVTTDQRGAIHEANLAAGRLLQVASEHLAGRPLIGFVARRDTVSFRDFLRGLESSRPEEGPRELLVRIRPRGQQPFMVAVRAYPLFSDRARPIVLRWILRKAELGDMRIGTHARLGWLVQALVDDMLAPVERVSAWAELVQRDDFVDADDRRQSRVWIDQSVEQLRRLRSDLEELAASCDLPNGDGVERFDVGAEVLQLVESARKNGSGPRLELSGLRQDVPLEILGSRLQLRRALEIVLGRAIAGTPVDRVVTMRAESQGKEMVLEIGSDAGRAPSGWKIRAATAMRIIESHLGRVTLDDGAAQVSLPLALE